MTSAILAVPANRLLGSLPAVEAARLAPIIKRVSLPQRAVLSEPGEEVEHVYFPHSGMVALLAVMADGRTVETATTGFDGAIGAAVGLGLHRTMTRAVVQVPLIASQIAAVPFRRAMQTSGVLREMIVQYIASLLGQVQMTAACNALHPLHSRLARWILQTQDSLQDDLIPLTQELLSEVLGVRRSSVGESAHRMQTAGLIHYNRGIIRIVNRRALEAVACDCYAAGRGAGGATGPIPAAVCRANAGSGGFR
jgi:CRP-like cAMP-binding protein